MASSVSGRLEKSPTRSAAQKSPSSKNHSAHTAWSSAVLSALGSTTFTPSARPGALADHIIGVQREGIECGSRSLLLLPLVLPIPGPSVMCAPSPRRAACSMVHVAIRYGAEGALPPWLHTRREGSVTARCTRRTHGPCRGHKFYTSNTYARATLPSRRESVDG